MHVKQSQGRGLRRRERSSWGTREAGAGRSSLTVVLVAALPAALGRRELRGQATIPVAAVPRAAAARCRLCTCEPNRDCGRSTHERRRCLSNSPGARVDGRALALASHLQRKTPAARNGGGRGRGAPRVLAHSARSSHRRAHRPRSPAPLARAAALLPLAGTDPNITANTSGNGTVTMNVAARDARDLRPGQHMLDK